MYRVLLVDDEQIERMALAKKIDRYYGDKVNIYQAVNGREAVAMCGEQKNDIVIMDISMPEMNGVMAAKYIRKMDDQCSIIFLSAYDDFEYARNAIKVRALDYLLKPISQNKLEQCMKPILRNMQGSYHVYKTKTETVKIPYNKILAFTSFRHYVDIITQPNDNQVFFRQKITLQNLQNQLPKEFVRCHRTVIVNMNKVMRLTNKDITLSDNSIYPVSESYLEHVREVFSTLLDI